jgi:hypothetical protein
MDNKDKLLDELSDLTNRSYSQTEFLLKLLDGDFKKLVRLEQKIKNNHLSYCPDDTNSINGKRYVGDHSTNNLEKDKYLGSGNLFWEKVLEYGRENFKREIIEFFPTKKEAFDAQEKYIILYETHVTQKGYNISWKGGHNVKDCISEETKLKLSIKGKKPKSEEHKKNISKANKGQISWSKGKTGIWYHSEKSKQKMKKPHGKMTTENVEKNRVGHLKENLSEKTINKMSESATERWRKRSLNNIINLLYVRWQKC